MKVFITGGSGFLGRHLVRKLAKSELSVLDYPSSRECNLLKQSPLDAWKKTKYDYIIHLAAWTQAGRFCLDHPGEQWINNQLINTQVLRWWTESQPQAKLIFMGTSCSYPEELEHSEDNYLKGMPTESLYTYAMTKRMLLVGARALSKQYGMKYCSFVPSTLFGNDYHNDGRQMHFIFDLVKKIVDGSNGEKEPVLWGDGYQVRELMHVEDFINIMVMLMPVVDNDLINIGGFNVGSIRQFAEMICDITGYSKDLIIYDTGKYVGARKKVLSNRKLKTLITIPDLKPIKEALSETVEWYKDSIA